jgi:hydrogenase expression/formation protein HypC
MCVAIPAQIKTSDGLEAEVEIGAVRRTISLWLTPEAKVGNYVYNHAGYAISVVDEEDALESVRLFQELVETYAVDELFRSADDLVSR